VQGCIELLKRYNIPIEGRHAVVIGRSNIVGLPASQLLLQENATVTIAHSRTADIAAVVREADIVVAAIGKANFVKGEWLKPGAVVIDVGINSVPDASKKAG
jgi:methylenetetrahydrofolate dehydrogenase (NADP+)/methenyltetrahydrofolate cyclohydrolase/formyltetrahydrofolate synthetase